MQVRTSTVVGVLLIALGMGMATAVDRGLTHFWPPWARSAWAIALIAMTFGGVIVTLIGLGVISNKNLAAVGSPGGDRSPSVPIFVSAYLGLLVVVVVLSFVAQSTLHVHAENAMLVLCGAFFLLGATGRPWWLYGTIRRLRWFAAIGSDRAMRAVLALLGVLLVIGGIAARM